MVQIDLKDQENVYERIRTRKIIQQKGYFLT